MNEIDDTEASPEDTKLANTAEQAVAEYVKELVPKLAGEHDFSQLDSACAIMVGLIANAAVVHFGCGTACGEGEDTLREDWMELARTMFDRAVTTRAAQAAQASIVGEKPAESKPN